MHAQHVSVTHPMRRLSGWRHHPGPEGAAFRSSQWQPLLAACDGSPNFLEVCAHSLAVDCFLRHKFRGSSYSQPVTTVQVLRPAPSASVSSAQSSMQFVNSQTRDVSRRFPRSLILLLQQIMVKAFGSSSPCSQTACMHSKCAVSQRQQVNMTACTGGSTQLQQP
eukprot:299436-Pelagomonas_calceolata.AAC.3